MAQQRPTFSDKKMEVEDRIFLPYTLGDVIKNIEGRNKPILDEICSIIIGWDSISPPQGLRVYCYGRNNSLEIYFLPYLYEDGRRLPSEGGPKVNLCVNDPLAMLGSAIVDDIFPDPQKVADFYGSPIYENGRSEVTIICKKNIPLFVPVSQGEYLRALIAKQEQNTNNNSGSDADKTFQKMEEAYQQLLKTDKEAANEFKQQMEEYRDEVRKNGSESKATDFIASLKRELSVLTEEEKNRQAYFSLGAMEVHHNFSGLLPYENREDGDALVKANPALIDNSIVNRIQLLVISWSTGANNQNEDKPRCYNEGRDGFHLADNSIRKLYLSKRIWAEIFRICN